MMVTDYGIREVMRHERKATPPVRLTPKGEALVLRVYGAALGTAGFLGLVLMFGVAGMFGVE